VRDRPGARDRRAIVALLDRDEAAAAEIVAEIEKGGRRAIAVQCDVSDAASVGTAAEAVASRLGPCNVLVNNAAIIYPDALLNIKVDKWNQLLAVNVTGYLLCAQAFGRQMTNLRGGSMVHVGSLSAIFRSHTAAPYSVSKAGVSMLSRLLALDSATSAFVATR
jgi:NAD(P)-dependent dehydrogenase (short-subunit alcohol dehydrogenase family)